MSHMAVAHRAKPTPTAAPNIIIFFFWSSSAEVGVLVALVALSLTAIGLAVSTVCSGVVY